MMRKFTPAEDQLILDQATGRIKLSMIKMEKILSSNQTTLIRRAEELGVTIRGTEEAHDPCRITGEDKLLRNLIKYHSGRKPNE